MRRERNVQICVTCASPRYGRCHPVEDAIRNGETEGLHVNADPLADPGELVTRARARCGLA
jgi:hypothetical protein